VLDVRGGVPVSLMVLSEPTQRLGQVWAPLMVATSNWSFEDAREKVLSAWADLDPFDQRQLVRRALAAVFGVPVAA